MKKKLLLVSISFLRNKYFDFDPAQHINIQILLSSIYRNPNTCFYINKRVFPYFIIYYFHWSRMFFVTWDQDEHKNDVNMCSKAGNRIG